MFLLFRDGLSPRAAQGQRKNPEGTRPPGFLFATMRRAPTWALPSRPGPLVKLAGPAERHATYHGGHPMSMAAQGGALPLQLLPVDGRVPGNILTKGIHGVPPGRRLSEGGMAGGIRNDPDPRKLPGHGLWMSRALGVGPCAFDGKVRLEGHHYRWRRLSRTGSASGPRARPRRLANENSRGRRTRKAAIPSSLRESDGSRWRAGPAHRGEAARWPCIQCHTRKLTYSTRACMDTLA